MTERDIAAITFVMSDVHAARVKYERAYRRRLEDLPWAAQRGYVTEAAVCRILNGDYRKLNYNTSDGQDLNYNGFRIDTKFRWSNNYSSREIKTKMLRKIDIDYVMYFVRKPQTGPGQIVKSCDEFVGTVILYEGYVPFRILQQRNGSIPVSQLMWGLPGELLPDEENEAFGNL